MSSFYYDIANVPRIFAVSLCLFAGVYAVAAQEPAIVQPGAPGQPTKVLPASTRAKLPPISRQDVEFMQGMIMHHAQAVEMVDLIAERTTNRDIRMLGDRIAQSQADEMKFMRQWLEMRGHPTEHAMPARADAHGAHHGESKPSQHLMPGMLTDQQMDLLRKAKGAEFDRLFLTGMIQHHEGALVMVKELFAHGGSGQDAELYNFATDVDSGQRAEIARMRNLLSKLTVERKS